MKLPWLEIAESQIGVAEIVGRQHSPTVMGYINYVGSAALGIIVNDDEAPWCGSFMAYVMKQCHFALPKIAVRASSWDMFGVHCGVTTGCVGRFQRPGGGHVGLIDGKRIVEGVKQYRVLGGNTKNKVGYGWIDANRLVAARWPKEYPMTFQPLKLFVGNNEATSRNEA